MEEMQTLIPDRETFLRVWRRVMPDEAVSPVEVKGWDPPRPPERPDRPGGQERPVTPGELMEELDRGLSRLEWLARRYPPVRPLLASLGEDAADLRAIYYVETGRPWRGRPRPPAQGWEDIRAMLRRQYLWELGWQQLCRRARGEELEELRPRLEEHSRRRRAALRRLLGGR